MLFTFKDGDIKRIDASFAHRNYYYCHFLCYSTLLESFVLEDNY